MCRLIGISGQDRGIRAQTRPGHDIQGECHGSGGPPKLTGGTVRGAPQPPLASRAGAAARDRRPPGRCLGGGLSPRMTMPRATARRHRVAMYHVMEPTNRRPINGAYPPTARRRAPAATTPLDVGRGALFRTWRRPSDHGDSPTGAVVGRCRPVHVAWGQGAPAAFHRTVASRPFRGPHHYRGTLPTTTPTGVSGHQPHRVVGCPPGAPSQPCEPR
jgi:hypothetical protein